MTMAHVPLPGSEPPRPPALRKLEPPPDDLVVRLSVLVKRPAEARRHLAELRRELQSAVPRKRNYLTRESLTRLAAPGPEPVERLRAFAHQFGLRLEEQPQLRGLGHVILTGRVADVERAFEVRLLVHRVHDEIYLWHEGPAHVPAELQDVIQTVVGLHTEPLETHSTPARAGSPPQGVDPRIVAEAYDFPCGDATGESIAVILLGGGFDPLDLQQHFAALGLNHPQVDVVSVNGQANNPAPAASIAAMLGGATPDAQTLWTIEASLDVELIGTLANGARIVVYFAPNNNQGKLEAFDRAMSDPAGVSVISCSFGSYEVTQTQAYLEAMDQRCETAGLLGITVCVSSGDRGDGAEGGPTPRVRFPASSPNVLACGGTHAVVKSSGAIVESVWNELFFGQQFSSGGGVSQVFGLPSWQSSADVPGAAGGAVGRGVPDVAARADMLNGYPIRVRGFTFNMGGTSAAAPLWASLAARLNQQLGTPIGHINGLIYAPPSALRDITNGNSGPVFSARQDWDACTGLGTPNGGALLKLLT